MLFSTHNPMHVTEITRLIKETLEGNFQDVSVEGEISNFKRASSGHCYFSLKDQDALLQAVMFRGAAAGLDFIPTDGKKVIARGKISLYAQRGSYQLICQSMTISGQGDILQILEERKQRLAAEGLFDQGNKKSLPKFPQKIAVITSPTGAAIRDILQVLNRRNPYISVIILPAAVQGDNAAQEITQQIIQANDYNMAEVLIVGRGGGSLEDLLAFSDESVVRAVAASTIPVISAVGHEIDVALSDFAADLRAPTPSAAAELVTPDMQQIIQRIDEITLTLAPVLTDKINQVRQRLSFLDSSKLKEQLSHLVQPRRMELNHLKEGLNSTMLQRISQIRQELALKEGELQSLSPNSLLKRGFAYVTDENDRHIHGASQVNRDDNIKIQFYKDGLIAQVKDTINEGI
ncbi:MAG: exodeoxyribonuclease VII large subunit [Spirochaetaceae bacterium]|jgi:exodeoxyribonuclease VII large subunit|nr:exodeoxyribonuclease VII large subunit [Spirochaetaceae bacterium]